MISTERRTRDSYLPVGMIPRAVAFVSLVPSTGNDAPPLTPWAQLAQALLASNEFAFVD